MTRLVRLLLAGLFLSVPAAAQLRSVGVTPITGGVVTTVNSVSGAVTLAAGTNITITPSGSTFTFAASGGATPTCDANQVVAGPASGAAAEAACRSLVSLDLGSFTLQPSFKNLTVQPLLDTISSVYRRCCSGQVSNIMEFQDEANGLLSAIAPTGNFIGNVDGTADAATALAADPADCSLPNVALGIVASGAATCGQPSNVTGNAATVTTNANLTGPITSTGNATAVAAQTGTGSVFAMQDSPAFTTPGIGVASGTSVALTAANSFPTVANVATEGAGVTSIRKIYSNIGLTAGLGTTTIYTTPAADGWYQFTVSFYLSTVATSGTMSTTIVYTAAEDSSTQTITTTSGQLTTMKTFTPTVLNMNPVRLKASTVISVATTFNTVVGSPVYNMYGYVTYVGP